MTDPKILVVYVPLTFAQISTKFFKSFLEMTGEDIRKDLREKYGIEMILMIHDKFPIDLNRNDAFDRAVSKYDADYIMCCDADQVFQKNTIPTLLNTLLESDVDAVTGVYFRKSPPHKTVVGKYSTWNKDIELKRQSLYEQGFITNDDHQTLFYKPLTHFDVVQPVDISGLGCFLFKADILKRIEQPFCKYVNPYSTGGDFTFEGHSEDMWFFSQLKKAGVKILVNPKVVAGHIVEKVIIGNEAEL